MMAIVTEDDSASLLRVFTTCDCGFELPADSRARKNVLAESKRKRKESDRTRAATLIRSGTKQSGQLLLRGLGQFQFRFADVLDFNGGGPVHIEVVAVETGYGSLKMDFIFRERTVLQPEFDGA